MYEEKEHNCTGDECIFCRIFTRGQAEIRGQGLVAEQSLLKLKAIPAIEGIVSKGLMGDQVNRLELIERMAFYDQVTGISNAHAFMRELQEEVARAQRYKRPLSICMLRVNQFIDITSKYGLLGGDMVLKHVADVLKESLRGVDMAAHYQGEKFAIVLPETNNAGALVVAERVTKRIAGKPVKLSQQTINITVAAGVATFLKHGQSRDELIRAGLSAVTNITT